MNFIEGPWKEQINVTDFVRLNLTPYEGDASFLVGPTDRTRKLWNICLQALEEERTLYFPDEYKIDYLNHQSVKTSEAI